MKPFVEYSWDKHGNLTCLFEREAQLNRAHFALTSPAYVFMPESVDQLNTNLFPACELPKEMLAAMAAGKARAINSLHPGADALMKLPFHRDTSKKRVHIIALGDVGAMLAIGLRLEGHDCIHTIGLYDINAALVDRYAFEISQIQWPFEPDRLPGIVPLKEGEVFDCDVFVFCASAGVPAVGAEIEDVRMAQLQGNSHILERYATMAREKNFRGLFAIVSDPVDILCQCAYYTSNQDERGLYDGNGLLPEQIRGYGLGVMHARACYHARKDARFSKYLQEGRAYGPHGKGLIIANNAEHYEDDLSRELTALTVNANIYMRSLGYKPYIAPALSSGALSLLLTLRGEWHYSAVFLGGIYWGCKNRETPAGMEIEALALNDTLQLRLREAAHTLWEEGALWRSIESSC